MKEEESYDANLIQVFGLEQKIIDLFEERKQKIYQDIADILFVEYEVSISPESIEEHIKNTMHQQMSDVELLNKMIAEGRDTLFGDSGIGMAHEDRVEYMRLVQSLLNTKNKILGLDTTPDKKKDADSEKLKEALSSAGIQFNGQKLNNKGNSDEK